VPVLRQRLILGPILIALIVLGVWLDEVIDKLATPGWLDWIPGITDTLPPGVVALVVCVVVCIFGTLELTRILWDKGLRVSKRVMSLSATAGLVAQALVPSQVDGATGFALASMVATMVLSAALAFHSRNRTVEGVVAAAGGTLLAFVYLGLMLGFVVAIRREHSGWTLLWVLVTTKSCDIGAYFTGRTIGRHKLILWLSPGKTWEGFIGGVLFAGVVGAVGAWVLSSVGVKSPSSIAIGAGAGVADREPVQARRRDQGCRRRSAGLRRGARRARLAALGAAGGILDPEGRRMN
jgi:phosphatidate cytidylyltransferase